MEIIGTGIDATEISRIAAAIERYGDRFVNRIFTSEEVTYCRGKRDAASAPGGPPAAT
jgi:holo-[acyl-carrier protein] synthase